MKNGNQRQRIYIAIYFLVALLMPASVHGQADNPVDNSIHQKLRHPNYLRIPMPRPIRSVDPIWGGLTTAGEVSNQMFAGLTALDADTSRAIPWLAESWEISDDGKTYTFHLRHDALWSNGEPLTAHDVVWTLRRNISKETSTLYASYLYHIENAMAIHRGENKDISTLGVKAIDDHTLEFKLHKPVAFFPELASIALFRPVPQKVIERHGEQWIRPQNIVTSGPYTLKRWRKENFLILVKNVMYFAADQVSISEIRYYIQPDINITLELYKRNELDILGGTYSSIPPYEIGRILRDPYMSKEFNLRPKLKTTYLGFNHKNPPMDNVWVRKSIAAAIDKKHLVTEIRKNFAKPASTFICPPIFGYIEDEEGIGIGYNVKTSREWLQKTGYSGGAMLPEIRLYCDTHGKLLAETIRLMLRNNLNMQIQIKVLPLETMLNKIIDKDAAHHMFIAGWEADYPDGHNFLSDAFHPLKTVNRLHWKNKEYADLLDQAISISDSEQRKALYKEAEVILNEKAAAIVPLYFHRSLLLSKPWLNWQYRLMGGQKIWEWSFK